MFKPLLLAGLAAAALAPSLANAQTSCQTQSGANRVVGTVIGAGIGALLGNAIGEHGGKTGGTIIGGVGGGVAGNMIAGSASHCQSNRYGYYDRNGRWTPNTSTNYGYYDADGHWVDNSNSYATRQGYASQPAYAPPPTGDADHRDYRRQGEWTDNRQDLTAREAWLESDIRQRIDNGTLDRHAGHDALRTLRDIRRDDANARDDDNQVPPDQRADLERRLDDLASRVGDDHRAEDDRARPSQGY